MSRSLVVKVTSGVEAPERCSQGFTVAAAAAAAGVPVSLWLTGEAVWWAVEGRQPELDLAHSTPIPELLEVIGTAGSVTVCAACAARRELRLGDLINGATIAGAASFVAESMADGAQALVY